MGGQTQARGIEGDIVRRGDPGYESAWRGILWNGLKPPRFPEAIVRVASEHDVPKAVALARSEGLRIAVRSGGHSWCGSPLRDGGMLIDLSALNRIHIDPPATATVQPAATGSALASELSRYGLAFPTGHCGSVAVGGYLLGGGLGWNSGALGPACASVRQIEAVTAAGEVVSCDEDENSDLFWAARGAGPGFFAIVTGFRLALYPRPAAIVATTYAFPLADVVPVTRWVTEAATELPPTVELSFVLGTADPAMSAATPRPKVIIVAATAFADSQDEAIRSLGPLRVCPLADHAIFSQVDEPTSSEALYETSDSLWPASHRCSADTLWSGADYETLLSRLAPVVATAPSEKSLVLAPVSPVSRGKTLQHEMAFSVLGDSYVVPYALWDSPAQDDANIGWLHHAMRTVKPLGTGHYIAEADLTAAPSRAHRSFSPSDWDRLGRLKARYDPEDVFFSYLGRSTTWAP